jgi:hypothetical protein
LYQALADPRKSQELTKFTKDIVDNEPVSLHNNVIQIQQDNIVSLKLELKRMQTEHMNAINAHTNEVLGIHRQHDAEIQALHGEYKHML